MKTIGLIFIGVWGILGGFEWVIDSYYCWKYIPNILPVDTVDNIIQNMYLIDFSSYESWYKTKIEAALQLDLSKENYIAEKNIENIIINNNVSNNNSTILNDKEYFSNYKTEVEQSLDKANSQSINKKLDLKVKELIIDQTDLYDDNSDLV